MEYYILNYSNALSYLENLNKKKLKDWIVQCLKNNKTDPFILLTDEEYSSEIIFQLYNLSKKLEFRQKVRSILITEFRNFSFEPFNPYYLTQLLFLIGQLNLKKCYNQLLAFAKRGTLKSKKFDIDLHLFLIKILFGMDINKDDVKEIIYQHINDYKYSLLCFRKLTELPKGSRLAIEVFSNLLSLYNEYPDKMDLKNTLKRFIDRIGRENFYRYFTYMIIESKQFIESFLLILTQIGFYFDYDFEKYSDYFIEDIYGEPKLYISYEDWSTMTFRKTILQDYLYENKNIFNFNRIYGNYRKSMSEIRSMI